MNNHEIERMEDRLTPPPAPAPPADLLEKIQREIPEYLSVVPEPQGAPGSSWRVKLLAASVVLVVLSGAVVYQLRRSGSSLEDRVAMETATEPVVAAPAKDVPAQLSTEEEATDVQVLEPATLETEPIALEDKPVARAPQPSTSKNESAPAATESGVLDDARARSEPAPAPAEKRSRVETPPVAGTSAQVPEKPGSARSDEVGLMGRELRGGSDTQPLPESQAAAEGSSSRRQSPMAESEERRALGYSSGARLEGYIAAPAELPAAPPSTGGTAEPNDAPYGDMFFRAYGTNPFVDTEDDPLSTFGLDVDTGSFTLARSYLDRGHLPPSEAIRVEEFVNYFDYHDPAPRRGEFTLIAEGAPSPFADGPRYQLVRFAIKAREIDRAARQQPAVLIFVVDVSGSMGRENRLELVKDSLELLLEELGPDDEIGLVVYGSRGEVLLEPTRSKESIRRALARLVPGGSTNAEEGLALAYNLARRFYREGAIHRIILCSDGVANVGRTGPESILERVRDAADDGIELTTVGFGMGNYNDVLMEQLADQGDGSYAYVDSLDEAHRIFVENLTGMLQTIAADAKAQVQFNPATVSRYRLLGYENRDIADERFRDDTVDAGEIGAGHAVTALYEIKLVEGVSRNQRLATLRLRYRSKATGEIVESAIDLDRRHLAASWKQASIALRLSSLAAEFAERLKGTYWARDEGYDDLERRLQPVADELAGDKRVEELVYLVQRARRLDFDSRNVIEE